ncbi:MAG: hypothetical protein Q4G07_00970 [Oscillospiraceae bacterium]|nr:hypothetical protein [Oscillospiraceae bacterium]
MDLETYRKKLHVRIRAAGIFILVSLTAPSIVLIRLFSESAEGSHYAGFISGALCGLSLVLVSLIFRWRKALQDDAACKQMYLKEYDEREIALWQKAGQSSFLFEVYGLLLAGLIAGYFSLPVCFALIGASFFVALLRKGFRLYYKKHM